jgi:hypothetical protein
VIEYLVLGLASGLLIGLRFRRRALPPPPAEPVDLDELVDAVNRGVQLLDALANRCQKCGKKFRPRVYFTTSTARWSEHVQAWESLRCRCHDEPAKGAA